MGIFDDKLAAEIGLDGAVVFSKISYWQKKMGRPVYNSYRDWLRQLPWMSRSSVRRTLDMLERKGLISSTTDASNRKFYSILSQVVVHPCVQNEHSYAQNEQTPVQNEQTSAQIEHDFQATNINTNKKKNIKKKKDDIFWLEYQQLHEFFQKKRGGKGKPNKNNLENFIYWRGTYDLLDMKYAIACIDFDDYWSKSNITLDVLLRKKTPNQEPCDRIGQFMGVNAKGYVDFDGLLNNYLMLRKWWEKKPVLNKHDAAGIVLALRFFSFQTEANEYIKKVKDSLEEEKNASNTKNI